LGAWIDVNLYNPIPFYALLSFAKELKEDALEMDVISAEFDIADTYLRQIGVPLSSKMTQTFFNNSTSLQPNTLGNELDRNSKQVPIINTGNKENADFLVNLTEYHGTIYFLLITS